MGLKDNNNKNYESLVSRLYECKLVKRGITPGTEVSFLLLLKKKRKSDYLLSIIEEVKISTPSLCKSNNNFNKLFKL